MSHVSIIVLSIVALFSSSFAQAPKPAAEKVPVVSVPTFANVSCPIMGKPISTKLFVDTAKGRIYVCCKACNKTILADVDTAHRTAYPVVEKATNATCPVMGEAIEPDSPKVVVQGREIAVCCEMCIPKVRQNAQIVLAKLANPKLVDLDNSACPVTGEPAAVNTFCLIDDTLVRLSSAQCLEAVQKEPAKMLAKAKEIQARDEAARKAQKAKEEAEKSKGKKG